MARKMIFTLGLELFNKIREQPNLLDLHHEFEMRGHSLSRSLLIWEKMGSPSSWSLSDIGNEKFYHIIKRSDTEMEVLEEDWDAVELRIPPRDYNLHGTYEGIIDWLKSAGLSIIDLEKLKRTDLSERKLDFEIVYSDLLAVYELLQGILTSSRVAFLNLSNDDVQKIRTSLEQFWMIIDTINRVGLSTSRDDHKKILQQILQFCDEVKQQLGPIIASLRSKKSEELETQLLKQLETQVNAAVVRAEEKFNTATNLLQKQREEAENNESARQKEFAELKNKLEDELAKETVSKHKTIFFEQAQRHQQSAWIWLTITVLLIGASLLGIISGKLFAVLKLAEFEGTGWTEVLQSMFGKGFALSLIYFALSRSIKNYTAQKHLEVINRHRQNALETFDAFVKASGDNREARDAVLLAATNAIFDANQSGYLSSKTKGTESANPIQQVVRAVLPGSSPTKPEN